MRYKDRTISSVAGMLKALRAQAKPKQLVWFRCQSRKKWKLVPGLARVPSRLKAENALIKRSMQNAMPLIGIPPRDEWEWMFLMQHHRALTRLLDWTESPPAALYFAVRETEHIGAAGAVWCLDAVALNKVANLKFEFEAERKLRRISPKATTISLSSIDTRNHQMMVTQSKIASKSS